MQRSLEQEHQAEARPLHGLWELIQGHAAGLDPGMQTSEPTLCLPKHGGSEGSYSCHRRQSGTACDRLCTEHFPAWLHPNLTAPCGCRDTKKSALQTLRLRAVMSHRVRAELELKPRFTACQSLPASLLLLVQTTAQNCLPVHKFSQKQKNKSHTLKHNWANH